MDNQGYPTANELNDITAWTHSFSGEDMASEAMQFFERIASEMWNYSEWGVEWKDDEHDFTHEPVRKLYISTAGWSGNEEVIQAIQSNWQLMMYWEQSRRGGHYIFEFKLPQPGETNALKQ